MKKASILFVAAWATLLLAAPPARDEVRIEKELKLEPGGKLVLDVDAGRVDIKGSPKPGVRIQITSPRSDLEERFDFKFEEAPGTVTVTARRKGVLQKWLSGGGEEAPSFVVEVPGQTDLEVDTGGGHVKVSSIAGGADLRTSGGHIAVSDLKGKLAAHTSGGHIEIRAIDGNAKVETSGGHIDADSVKGALEVSTSGGHLSLKEVSGDIRAETSGGHIEIVGAGGRVEAETSGGSVEVSFAPGNSRGGRLETSGGGVDVKIDKSANLTIDADTSDGSVRCALPITTTGETSRSTLKGSIGKGGELLVIRASAGSIRIDPL